MMHEYLTFADGTMVLRSDLKPDDRGGTEPYVSMAPAPEVEERRVAFKRLKGVLGKSVNLDEARAERLGKATL